MSSTKRSGYQTSLAGLVGAMLLCLLIIGAFVGIRSLVRDNQTFTPDAIDYRPVVKAYQDAGADALYPASLPEGWKVTSIENAPGSNPVFGMGILTDEEKFIGFSWQDSGPRGMVEARIDEPKEGDEVELPSDLITGPWTLWTSDKDSAWTADLDGRTVMVWGSLPMADVETLVESLTTEKLAD